jgi:uncharacterized peroxidase-related enzyme
LIEVIPSVRLEILNSGYQFGPRLLFALIRLASRRPVPDAAKLVFYRPGFYGTQMKEFTHAAMRGPSEWSIADRELMAAFVSMTNECPFCVGAHTATAAKAYGDRSKVTAVLSNLESAPIPEPLRATLRMLGKLTSDQIVDAQDMRSALAAGASAEQIRDALAVSFAFNTIDRLASAFGFEVLSREGFDAGARFLLRRGYH